MAGLILSLIQWTLKMSMLDQDRITDLLFKNVKCYLCLEEFNDPRLLDCYHSFCLDCLNGYLEIFDEDFIECPLCDKKTERPTDAGELKKNIYLQLNETEIGVSCSICGEDEFARSHCIECNQDFCRGCIKSHGGITATREHHLMNIDKDNPSGTVLRDLYCKIHSEENLNYFCVECQHLICKHCNLTAHKTHTSKHVSEVATTLRKKLEANTESEEHKNYLMWLAERRETFSKEIDNCRRSEKQSIQDIIDRADEVIAILTEIKQIMIKKAGDITLKKKNPLKEKMFKFEKQLRSFSEILLHSRNLHKQADDLEIVVSSLKITKIIDSLKKQKDHLDFEIGGYSVFKPGSATTDQILPYFGDVLIGDEMHQGTKKKMYDFITEQNETVLSMLPLADQRTWVVESGGKFKLYDTSGRIHRQLKLGFHADDVFATNEHIIVSGNSSKTVQVFDLTLNELTSIKMDLCSRGIAFDPIDKSIYTCLTEKNAFFDHDPIHNNKIVRIMPKGKRYEIPDILIFSGNPTVEYPARIAITTNGCVAVSDWKRNCVIILNKSGYIESEHFYVAGDDITDKLCPRGICTDNYGNVYIADYNNNRILKLHEKINEVKVVLNAKDGIEKPWAVAFGEDGLLWVGSKTGKIIVHYFKQPDHSLYKTR